MFANIVAEYMLIYIVGQLLVVIYGCQIWVRAIILLHILCDILHSSILLDALICLPIIAGGNTLIVAAIAVDIIVQDVVGGIIVAALLLGGIVAVLLVWY